MKFHQMILIEIVKITFRSCLHNHNYDQFGWFFNHPFLEMKKVSKHLYTLLMARCGVLDPQFDPSNKRQYKIVKQNTFVLHSDEWFKFLTKGKQTYENVNKHIER